ncbi:MAG: hypothetical protein HZB53_08615 [Chloroflexi bacterium]|nr:hypothetical protein [Chloroflexota bacterium]
MCQREIVQSATAVANATTMRLADGMGVSATVLTGSASATGDVVTPPVLSGLTADHIYRLVIQFTAGGNTFQAVVEVAREE